MELIRSERLWEERSVKTYIETEAKTNSGDKFVIKIHEDDKQGIKCDVEKSND